MGDDRRQPHLEALDVTAPCSQLAGCDAGDDTATLDATGRVVDDQRLVAEVKGHGDCRVRHHAEVDRVESAASRNPAMLTPGRPGRDFTAMSQTDAAPRVDSSERTSPRYGAPGF